jgi:hypothetical protein
MANANCTLNYRQRLPQQRRARHGHHRSEDRRSGQKVSPLVRSRGMELGLRTEWLPKMQTSLSLYRLDFDSELTYIGDAGTTEAGDRRAAARRRVLELLQAVEVAVGRPRPGLCPRPHARRCEGR